MYIPECLLGIYYCVHGFDQSSNSNFFGYDCVGPKEMVSYKYSLSYQQVHDLYLPLAPSFSRRCLVSASVFWVTKIFPALLKISEKCFSRKIEFRLKII